VRDPRRTINIVSTMANLFGCHDDEDIIDKLCHLSDLAANVRISLVNSDLVTAAEEMSLTVEQFELNFAEWEPIG
jgi:hypothetical protein